MNYTSSNSSITNEIIKEIENNPEWEAKFERQCDLEERMRSMGVDRYWTEVNRHVDRNNASELKPARRLLQNSLESVTQSIVKWLENAYSGKAGKKHTAAKYLSKIEPETAAAVALRCVFDGIAQEAQLVPVARRIGSLLEDELAFRSYKEQSPTQFKHLVKRERKVNATQYSRQRRTMYVNMKNQNVSWESWPADVQVHVGSLLIELVVQSTGLVQQVTRTVDVKRQEVVIEATPECMEWIKEEHNRNALMAPVYLPTIIPPRPWQSPVQGGYWTKRVRRLPLVKTFSKAYIEELTEHDMPEVYDAVNAIQHTPWVINTRILEVAQTLWRNGSTLGGIPETEEVPLPVRPEFMVDDKPREEWTDEEVLKFKQWKRAATDTHRYNARLKSLRLQFMKVLSTAEMFEREEEIYFPHQMDFRGRIYAVPMFLNPQGSDLAKGLLEFANGVAINDEEDRGWLAIHLANSYGFDKAALKDRIRWVEEHEEIILACAEDPYSNKFWDEADKPFQFLAGCMEWAEFKKEGYGYISTVPIQMDGSCNGLQNFSAMLRDPIGGEAVNLVPSELPADIYQKVADKVLEQVEKDALSEDPDKARLAQGWLKLGINRKVCKRPVMTLAYGAKQFGFKQQVFEDTVYPAKIKLRNEFPFKDAGWEGADYMGALIWDAVAKVVVAARQAMDWLQKAAKAATKEGLPVRWETPDNFVVLQAYPKLLSKRVKLVFGGVEHKITVATGTKRELDSNKQANGISPNWIHSMDASHMRATVRMCWAEGIRNFSLIHDSYGTHAGNAWALAKLLRQAFVDMYEDDLMGNFKSDLELQLPDGVTLEALPKAGDLDLSLVLESDFFFA